MAWDMGLIRSAMTALNYEQDLVDQVVSLLRSSSDQLTSGRQDVTKVAPDWFGGAPTAHRLGVNTDMAHQAVAEEFQKLADSLRQYGDAITTWGNEVLAVDGDTNAEMTMRAKALQEVEATLLEARREAADRAIGDGDHKHQSAEQPTDTLAAPTSRSSTSTSGSGS